MKHFKISYSRLSGDLSDLIVSVPSLHAKSITFATKWIRENLMMPRGLVLIAVEEVPTV